MRRLCGVAAPLIFLVAFSISSLAAGRPEDKLARKIAKLEERIASLEERIRALEERIAYLSGALEIPGEEKLNFEQRWLRLTIGMTREEVRRLLGEPGEIATHSYLEIWDYSAKCGAPCSVTFDERGRVESYKFSW